MFKSNPKEERLPWIKTSNKSKMCKAELETITNLDIPYNDS